MGFEFPLLLLLLLLLPLLAWAYQRRVQEGRSSGHVLYPSLAQLARLSEPRWKRHLSAVLYGLALALAIAALARPQAVVPVPDPTATVIVTIDISLSMRAQDIQPTRFEAAKQEAKNFVRSLPDGIKVGLVSFAGYATLEAEPTTDHQRVIDQIELLQMARRTAIGDGLLESLRAIPKDENGKPLGPSTVVLLSDGRTNSGVDPMEVAPFARDMGVVVHTIGLGRRSNPGDPDQYWGGYWMQFDEETLRAIAEATGGQYYAAGSAEALRQAYRNLGRMVGWKPQRTEISGMFGLLAGVLLASSLLLANLRRQVI
ncbi:VWA domain-containing protein [Meiothermus ruber]|uniref:von Willebrand factor type A n=1 Tax=Meiothermus ruber (strain ATCC 35948 / DSM 1279 / VKM B-1258 / 21) TaxID=504728 RepID=D3PN57_MEIRD|nr:VWA domain-containing protein [Meiothermus ruber]ADD29384.1 von Willebrand factor type A [Meiothermus ruber DSM 1279]AGK05166.1 von Willebrand factor type A [Meiothermus ruber DSM 1279]MCL6530903.1 VWA domain-containing protein [Meiothermus ruber]